MLFQVRYFCEGLREKVKIYTHDKQSYYNLEQKYQYAFSEENSKAYRKDCTLLVKQLDVQVSDVLFGTLKSRTLF